MAKLCFIKSPDDHVQVSALSRGCDCLNWWIDETTVLVLLTFLTQLDLFFLICPALQKLGLLQFRETEGSYLCQL